MTSRQSLPKITVGVTVHNAQDTILRALRSAAAQSWPDLEILVVDDGSTDSSAEQIEAFAGADPRVRLLRHDRNKGYPAALNTLLCQATGLYIALFDDDDESAPDRLSRQYERLSRFENDHPGEIVFCYANRAVVKTQGMRPDHITKAIGRQPPEPRGPEVADFLLWEEDKPQKIWGAFGSCTLMGRRADFQDLGGFDESFRRCAEWDLAIRAAFKGAWFIAVDAPLVTQYKTLTPDKTSTQPLTYSLRLCDKYEPYLKDRRKYTLARALAHARFHYVRGHRWRSRVWRGVAGLFSPRIFYKKLKTLF